MRNQWIASEHHRMHTVEGWPDGPYKDATLRAIQSSISSLEQGSSDAAELACEVCLSRRRVTTIVRFPGSQQGDLAA
jgi:hypothetical protein